MRYCLLQYPLRIYHNAKVYNLHIIALKHNADNVLANIVNISLYGSSNNLARMLWSRALLHIRLKKVHCALHYFSAFNHLRQKHLALSKEFSYSAHSTHQGTLYKRDSISICTLKRLHKILLQPLRAPLQQQIKELLLRINGSNRASICTASVACACLLWSLLLLNALCKSHQPLCWGALLSGGVPVKNNILCTFK